MVRVWGVGPQSHPWEGYIIAAIRYPQAIILIISQIVEKWQKSKIFAQNRQTMLQ